MKLFDIQAKVGPKTALFLSSLLFIVSIGTYMAVTHVRHQENPADKITPTISQMADGFSRSAFQQ